ncbi:GNAT family N-acetyltransferase [Luteolibacter sp. LG18]|uniref:GNAT family N-acetyltransferase n=1 Tax=Luteolibacter sp. LG18 TaxID=2819286 RepID=UPI002B28088F|nr:acetyltransferase [Luteolibacter sp. LG18]
MKLVWPSSDHLPGHLNALERGWSPDTVRGEEAAREIRDKIAANAAGYLASLVDREAKGDPVKLPDSRVVTRLPGYYRWLWDGEFCGSINFRWQQGTPELPPTCLGHIGYSVVPWKRRKGYATEALRQLLPEAKAEGLPYVEITANVDNVPSQKVIVANGGVLVERVPKPPGYPPGEMVRFRIALT